MPPRIRIELLYFDGCPSFRQAWVDLLDVVVAGGHDVSVHPIQVASPERADALQFAGSPTIRVNGRDLEGYSGPGVMACRVYRENGNRGWPSKELLRAVLAAAERADLAAGAADRGPE